MLYFVNIFVNTSHLSCWSSLPKTPPFKIKKFHVFPLKRSIGCMWALLTRGEFKTQASASESEISFGNSVNTAWHGMKEDSPEWVLRGGVPTYSGVSYSSCGFVDTPQSNLNSRAVIYARLSGQIDSASAGVSLGGRALQWVMPTAVVQRWQRRGTDKQHKWHFRLSAEHHMA